MPCSLDPPICPGLINEDGWGTPDPATPDKTHPKKSTAIMEKNDAYYALFFLDFSLELSF